MKEGGGTSESPLIFVVNVFGSAKRKQEQNEQSSVQLLIKQRTFVQTKLQQSQVGTSMGARILKRIKRGGRK